MLFRSIGAGGGTTWERCCLGLPSIIVETAENQSGIADAMSCAGAGIAPGALNAPGFARTLGEAVAEAAAPVRLEALSQAAAAICDGDGAGRVLTALLPTERLSPAARASSPVGTRTLRSIR